MHKFFLILFSILCFGQSESRKDVSFDFFYKKEMQNIVRLKKELVNKKFNAIKQVALAELYANINCEDSAYATFYNVFEKENIKKTLNDEQFKDLLFQLHRTESSKHNYDKDKRFFLNQLYRITKNDISDKWISKIEYEKFKDFYADSLKHKQAFDKIETIQKTNFYKTNVEFQASVLLGLGNLYTAQQQYNLANKVLQQSLKLSQFNRLQLQQIYALINLGVNERIRGDFENSKFYLNQIDAIPNNKYRIKIARIVALQKQLVYEGLKDSTASKQQQQLFAKLDNLINDFAKNSNFYEIDVKFHTKEKDAKLAQLNDLENRFIRNKWFYGVLLFLVFLLAMYSFVRWKKTDLKKQKLLSEKIHVETQKKAIEDKHSVVVEELKTIKLLITENHLILKNNKKIYLNELEYIKSVDHYLEIYIGSKIEVVRGKISEILSQLPPNFEQSHRSYIINKNFILTKNPLDIVLKNNTIIPLGRKYKDNFND